MKVSTKYFNQNQIDSFGKMNKEIQKFKKELPVGETLFVHLTTPLLQSNYLLPKSKKIFLIVLRKMRMQPIED